MPKLFTGFFCFMALADIPDNTDERMHSALYGFSYGQFHRENRTVLTPSADLATNADNLGLTAFMVIAQITVMLAMIRLRHKNTDILSPDFIGCIAEKRGAGVIIGLYHPILVYSDD